MISANGEGNQLVAIAMQADSDIPYDSATAEKCKHVSFQAGKLTGYLVGVDAPEIDHAQTSGSHSEIEITGTVLKVWNTGLSSGRSRRPCSVVTIGVGWREKCVNGQ